MRPESIFVPMLVLVAWTFGVLVYTGYKRFGAGHAGRVKAHDFRYGESGNVPGDVAVANRNLMNLLEMPVLFYVVCLASFITGHVTTVMVSLAWLFVALRLAHTLVHLTYNRILHRFATYLASNAILAAMWVEFGLGLAG